MKITRREKLFLLGGAAIMGFFILIAGIIMPALNTKASLQQEMRNKDSQLRTIYDLSGKIKAAESQQAAGRRSGLKAFTLFGYLEELAGSLGIKDQIEYMKPIGENAKTAGESVEIKINGIYMEDFVGLMHGIRNCPKPVDVRRLNIRKMDRNKNLDVTFQVVLHG